MLYSFSNSKHYYMHLLFCGFCTCVCPSLYHMKGDCPVDFFSFSIANPVLSQKMKNMQTLKMNQIFKAMIGICPWHIYKSLYWTHLLLFDTSSIFKSIVNTEVIKNEKV